MDISELKKHKFIVMCEEHYTPLGVIRCLGESGIKPDVIIIKSKWNKVASASKYIANIYKVNSLEEGYDVLLSNYSNYNPKPFVIPCDDHFTSYLDVRMNVIKDLFYVSNAYYIPGRITYFQDKININAIAKKYGMNVAKTWVVKNGEIPEDIEYPVITKTLNSNSGGWKSSYHICNDEAELHEAYKTIPAESLFIQRFIKKKNELCLDGVIIDHGNDYLCMASKYTYVVPEGYSTEFVCSNFSDEPDFASLNKSLTGMFKEIGYEGIFSLEFLIDENDKLWFLEENFRSSTWTYVGTRFGMNFILFWANAMVKGCLPPNAEQRIPEGYKAMAEITDFNRRVLKHRISLKDWITEYKSCSCYLFYNKYDKRPFFSAIISKTIGLIHDRIHK